MCSASDWHQRLGRWGEELAARHLKAADHQIIERNYRCIYGEMDLVTLKDDEWIFVEVKTRRGDSFGTPEDAITKTKASRLLQVAASYLQEFDLVDVDWRVDLIAIELDRQGKLLRVEQIENAVDGW